jgi:hypothetical protein
MAVVGVWSFACGVSVADGEPGGFTTAVHVGEAVDVDVGVTVKVEASSVKLTAAVCEPSEFDALKTVPPTDRPEVGKATVESKCPKPSVTTGGSELNDKKPIANDIPMFGP